MKFHWIETEHALKSHVHQEAFILDTVERHNLSDCNKSPRAIPFRSCFPDNNIAPSQLSPNNQARFLRKYEQIIGDLNCFSISTRPDIMTIVSLLAAHTQLPAQAHYNTAIHVVKYLASTPSHGLYFTPNHTEPLHAFTHFSRHGSSFLTAYCNANWGGGLDASVPKPHVTLPEQSMVSLRLISGWLVMNAGTPIPWGCAHHKDTVQSSCQAEFYSVNETTELILEFKQLFWDLHILITALIDIKNNNQGVAQWTKGMATKRMRWINLRENLIRENITNKNIKVSHISSKLNRIS